MKIIRKYSELITILMLFCSSMLFFTWGIASQEVIGFDSRFYLFAQEMWRNGVSWFPTTYQQPYPDYLASSTTVIYLFAKMAGGVNKLVAILPTAIVASITLVLTYLIGALHNKRWGFCAVIFMLFTITFLKSARAISLDMYPTMVTAWCFYLLHSAEIKHQSRSMIWIYLLLLIGFAFRGPIGLVIPAGVICSYYLIDGRFKKLLTTGFWAAFLLIMSTGLLLLLAYHAGGKTFMQDVLRMQGVGRIDNHYLPFYFYFTDSLANYALSFLLAWLVMGGVIYAFITRQVLAHQSLLLKLIGWLFVILIGMTIPDDKKIRYILPIVPALALMAAYPFTVIDNRYFLGLRTLALRFFLLLPTILISLLGFIWIFANKKTFHFPIHYVSIVCFLCMMQLINLIAWQRTKRDIEILGVAAISFLIAYLFVDEPIELYLDRGSAFVAVVEKERSQYQSPLVFYRERPDGLPIKYLINMPSAINVHPVFVSEETSLFGFPRSTLFVASTAYFDALPYALSARFTIVNHGMLGHTAVIAFKQK